VKSRGIFTHSSKEEEGERGEGEGGREFPLISSTSTCVRTRHVQVPISPTFYEQQPDLC